MARPTKRTPENEKKICDLLRAGNTRKCAVEASGIDYQTFSNWIHANSGFSAAVSRAESEAEALHVTTIMKAAREGDWRASESWLKRRRRTEWGDSIDVRRIDDETLIKLLNGDTDAGIAGQTDSGGAEA